MKHITIVVPVWNEEKNIPALVNRIDLAFKKADFSYDVLFVDDHSTDNTTAAITALKKKYPVSLQIKQGEKGKAFSLCEGIRKADGDIVAIIDADLQYPPEAIPEMAAMLDNHVDVVVANRIKQKTSFARQFISSSFKKVFGNFLFGLNHDIQAGLKVFKKDICQHIEYHPSSGWTFDLEFLLRASQAGFGIENYDIEFSERANGKSKVSYIKTSLEIGFNALVLKTRPLQPTLFKPEEKDTMRGAGIGYKKKKYITHSTLSHTQSALTTITTPQRVFIFLILLSSLIALFLRPLPTLQVVIGILSTIYFIDTVFNFFLVMKSLHVPQEITSSEQELRKIDTRQLPIYSILCPLYKEAHVIPQFLEAIEKLDYPKNKLDVLLLLEEDDADSISKVERMYLPSYVRSIVVPHSMPKTKPKACNYGLSFAKGEYLVIYDAEDAPDPLQLKKAFLGFQKVGSNVLCLQAKLNYYNPHQNLLTRFFTAEYSLWFDITLTGLQAAGTSIPLGGTSNHFRTKDLLTLQGWDPFNVTEDADLGIRLFKRGYKTAIIDSVTLEEANSNVFNWIRQRSRWIKGYMQTYLVHTRKNFGLTHNNFLHSLFFHLNIGGKIAFILINPFLWLATISYFVLYRFVGPTIESLYPSYVFYMALISLVFGNFMFVYYYMIGAAKREQWSLIKYVYLIPFYWLLISWSGFIAFYQLIFKPHYWEKTIHGLHLRSLQKETIKETVAEIVVKTEEIHEGLQFPRFFRNKLISSFLKRKVWVGASILVVSLTIGNFLNFIFNAYLGRILDLNEFGLIGLVGGFVSISGIFMSALGSTVNYKSGFIIGKYGDDYAFRFWGYMRKYAIVVGAAIFLLWIVITPFLDGFFKTEEILLFILFSSVLLIGFAEAVDRAFISAKLLFQYLALILIIEPVGRLLLAVAFVHFNLTEYAYTSIPLAGIAAFLLGWFLVVRLNKKRDVKQIELTHEARKFPIKFYFVSLISGLANISFLSLDLILAKHFLLPNDAGRYAFISLAGKMVYFMGELASPFIMPIVSRNEGANKSSEKIFYMTLAGTCILLLLGFLAFGVFGYYTLPILFGSKILSVIPYIMLFSLGIFYFSVSKVFTTYYLTKRVYTFPIVAFAISILEIVLISLYHQDIESIVRVMAFVGFANMSVMILLHINSKTVKILENNFADFLGLFSKEKDKSESNNNKLSILIFNWRDTKHKWAGGAEVYIQEMAKRWVKEGNSVTIFCGNSIQRPKNEIIDGIQVYRRGGFYTVYIWAFLYYIVKFRSKYDVIIDSENGIPFFTPLYSRTKKFLLIHHVHQEVFRKSLKPPFSWLALFLEAKLMPIVYRNVQVITVSPSSRDEILKHKLTKKEPIVVYNGVELDLFKPAQKSKDPLILYLGRLQYYKSLNIFLRTAKEVLKNFPKSKFIIAGEGDEKQRLEKYAEKLGLKDKIKFVGKVTHEEKIRLFQKAWVFMNPSFMEGWGITTIEANACGTPAVASNVPGLTDSIQDTQTGILVHYADVPGFTQAIEQLISDKKMREELSHNAYEWAQKFSWEISSQEFYKILKQQPDEQSTLYRVAIK